MNITMTKVDRGVFEIIGRVGKAVILRPVKTQGRIIRFPKQLRPVFEL